jgi:hypothetical protein
MGMGKKEERIKVPERATSKEGAKRVTFKEGPYMDQRQSRTT